MNGQHQRETLKRLIIEGKTLIVPGAYDPLTARLVERAGFPAVYVGSYATAAVKLGMPDVGIVTMTEMIDHARAVANSVDIPVLADAENGWNNAANIWRAVREFEQAGICAIHIEDHERGKHTNVSPVIASVDQVVGKIRAALDARQDPNFLIIARTDVPWATKDIENAVARMNAFTEAGADLVMAAGMSPDILKDIRSRLHGKVVITDTPGYSAADEEAAGANIVLYYGFCLYAAYDAVSRALDSFRKVRDAGKVPQVRERIAEFEKFAGYPEFSERAKKYIRA
jgi:methylisocitrate lyase